MNGLAQGTEYLSVECWNYKSCGSSSTVTFGGISFQACRLSFIRLGPMTFKSKLDQILFSKNSKYSVILFIFANRIFRTEGKYPERPGMETIKAYRAKRVKQLSSAGILLSSGKAWWLNRSKAQQTCLKPKNVLYYKDVLGDIADDFVDRSVAINHSTRNINSLANFFSFCNV